MIEALWSVEFVAANGNYGGGVVIFESGRIFGGDSSFTTLVPTKSVAQS